jgi:hypothetical protein
MAIAACAEEAGVAYGVFCACFFEVVDDLALAELARDVEVALQTVFGGDDGEEIVDGE